MPDSKLTDVTDGQGTKHMTGKQSHPRSSNLILQHSGLPRLNAEIRSGRETRPSGFHCDRRVSAQAVASGATLTRLRSRLEQDQRSLASAPPVGRVTSVATEALTSIQAVLSFHLLTFSLLSDSITSLQHSVPPHRGVPHHGAPS